MPVISGNMPEHLVIGARAGFITAQAQSVAPWRQVAGEIPMTSKSLDLVDIGGAPMPVEDFDGGPERTIVERAILAKPRNWNVTVGVSYNAIQDDQTGTLDAKVKAAAANFDRHVNRLVFGALNAGDGTTYGLCYDGLVLYSASHVDKGAHYQTAQSNLPAVALTIANFDTVLTAARLYVDDQGVYTEHNYDTIITSPAYERTARQITDDTADYTTANRAVNPYAGKFTPIISPWMDAAAWILAACNQVQKPIYIVMRETPALQSAWFEPKGPDGGTYNFKFYGRYAPVFGDWRLSVLGHT